MFLSMYNRLSYLRISNTDDKSSSICSCIGCSVSSELYKSSKIDGTVISVLRSLRYAFCPAIYFQLSSVKVEYKLFLSRILVSRGSRDIYL